MKWRPIETMPKDEKRPFMVWCDSFCCDKKCAVEVEYFEGNLYPSYMDGIIDAGDKINGATHWREVVSGPDE